MKRNGDDRSGAESGKALRGKLAGGVIGGGREARERPGQIFPGIDLLEFAGAEDGVEDGGAPTGIGVADEEKVLFPEGTGPDAIFHCIGIDVHVAVTGLGIAGELRPAGQSASKLADLRRRRPSVDLGGTRPPGAFFEGPSEIRRPEVAIHLSVVSF